MKRPSHQGLINALNANVGVKVHVWECFVCSYTESVLSPKRIAPSRCGGPSSPELWGCVKEDSLSFRTVSVNLYWSHARCSLGKGTIGILSLVFIRFSSNRQQWKRDTHVDVLVFVPFPAWWWHALKFQMLAWKSCLTSDRTVNLFHSVSISP